MFKERENQLLLLEQTGEGLYPLGDTEENPYAFEDLWN